MSRGLRVVPLRRSVGSRLTGRVEVGQVLAVVLAVRPVSRRVRARRAIGRVLWAASTPGPLRRRGGLAVLALACAPVYVAMGSWPWAVVGVLIAAAEAALMVRLHRRGGGAS